MKGSQYGCRDPGQKENAVVQGQTTVESGIESRDRKSNISVTWKEADSG